jgi:broad specificity phosphatase PhoE
MRIGNNFVEEETRSAVLTEFGREYCGMRFKRTRGESGEDVRKRMERWKERVERAQRITSKFLAKQCIGW